MSRRKNTGPNVLTPLEQRFVDEYPKDLNATEAYKRAGGSERSAHALGPRLLQVPRVAAAIAASLQVRTERAKVEANDVLLELKAIGLSDVGELFDEKGQLLDLKKLPRAVRAAIASFEVAAIGGGKELDDGAVTPAVMRVIKVKFWDKPGALGLLGKYLRLWDSKVPGADDPPPAADPRVEMSADELKALARAQLEKERERAKNDRPTP